MLLLLLLLVVVVVLVVSAPLPARAPLHQCTVCCWVTCRPSVWMT